jgi:DNA-binding beta-propeller fold protein YncE
MKRGMLVVTLAVALAAAAGAQSWPPRLVASFPAPPGARDVAFEGWGPLYVLAPGTPSRLYKLTTSGSITASFTVSLPAGARGIAYEGYSPSRIWVSNRLNGYIYAFTTAGSLTSSFRCPVGKPYGLGFSVYNPTHGSGLFASCRDENRIVRLNPTTGSLLSSFAGPASAVIGYDDWLCVDRDSNYLYWDFNREWRVLDTLPARPYGVATGVLWPTDVDVSAFVLCRNAYIYFYMGYTAVAPASLGRVKALFR